MLPTFVLISGAGATSLMWAPVVRELAVRGHRALPVELPGHGLDAVFPVGYSCPQDSPALATARSPLAGLTLDDCVAHTLRLVRRVADHGPVILVGHSLGGSTVTGVANAEPGLLAHVVYLAAYCCVSLPSPAAYARTASDAVLTRARTTVWIGNPMRTGALRTNLRTADEELLAIQHELLMADLDPALVPAVLNYALQPDESLQVILANAQVDPQTWGTVPRTYIRTQRDHVIPPALQDRMIAEADALTPGDPFDVRTITASHFAPITQPAEIAGILTDLAGS